jgi:hypothetical protein
MRKSILVKIVMMMAIALITGTLLPGCGSKSLSEADVNYAGPILENVLTGMKEDNYADFSKDFSDQMKAALTQENFKTFKTSFDSKIGDYESKTFSGATTTSKDNKTYTIVVYKAKYSKESADVQITITFSDNNGKKIIEGLVFNSPNLKKQ